MNITGMMKRRWWIMGSLLVLTIILGENPLWAGMTTEEAMAKVTAKSATVNNYRADMSITADMMGQKLSSQGKMVFKKPNKSWVETVTDMGTMKMKQITISNGKTTWTYQPDTKMVTKVDLARITAETGERATGDLSKPFQGLPRDSISYVRTKKIDGGKVYIFQRNPKKTENQDSPFALGRMEIWIGAKDGLVRKMIMLNKEGKEMLSQSYTNIKVNTKVADSQFEFTPPEGAQVVDMTERVLDMIKQSKGAGK